MDRQMKRVSMGPWRLAALWMLLLPALGASHLIAANAQAPIPSTPPLLSIYAPREGQLVDPSTTVAAWSVTPGAATYQITLTQIRSDLAHSSPASSRSKPTTLIFPADPNDPQNDPRKTTFEIKNNVSLKDYGEAGSKNVALIQLTVEPGVEYRMLIAALDQPDPVSKHQAVLAEGERRFRTKGKAPQLGASGLHLQRSATIDPGSASEPAKISFQNKAGSTPTQDIEFALIYAPNTRDRPAYILPGEGRLRASVEALLSTDSNNRNDNAVRFRFTQTANLNFPRTTHPRASLF